MAINKTSIWDALGDTKVNMSFKEWLAVDKQAAKDLYDGIRYLHGRTPCNPNPNSHTTAQINAVNLVELDEKDGDEDEDSDDEGVSDSYLFDSELEHEDDNGYHSDTSVTQYPYNPISMGVARPFAIQVNINGHQVEAIADTGASVSVISKPLATRLELPVNKDLMSIQQLDERDTTPNGVCVNVPVQIGGKLRREHCSVLHRYSYLAYHGCVPMASRSILQHLLCQYRLKRARRTLWCRDILMPRLWDKVLE